MEALMVHYYHNEAFIKAMFIKELKKQKSVSFFELPIKDSRIDLCSINGHSVAYEIKTKYDTLKRLNKQVNDYLSAFEYVYVVCSSDKTGLVQSTVPNCVGIYGNHDVYETLNGVICFDHKLLGSKFTYTGFNGSHKYKPTQIFGYNQMDSIQQSTSLPRADVLFSHDGPFNREQDDAHCGLKGIDKYIQDNKPKTVIHGHLHKPNHYTYKYFLSSAEVYCVYQLAVVDFNDDGTVRELIQLETI